MLEEGPEGGIGILGLYSGRTYLSCIVIDREIDMIIA